MVVSYASHFKTAYDAGYKAWIVYATDPRTGTWVTPVHHAWIFATEQEAQAQAAALDGKLTRVSKDDEEAA